MLNLLGKIGFSLKKRYTAKKASTDEEIMLQSVVTLLLIPCLLLNQSAAFAHSHGDSTAAGHGVRLHIHFGGNCSADGHDEDHDHHGHSHHGHSHHEQDQQHSHVNDHKNEPKEPPKQQKSESCSAPFQHDLDCVYLAEVVAAGFDRTTLKVVQFDSLTSFDLSRWNRTDQQLRIHEKWSDWPPPLLFGDCPLYLRHLSLLI